MHNNLDPSPVQAAGTIPELRKQYREQKAALMTQLGQEGASIRGMRRTLSKLAIVTDQTLRLLWRRAGFKSNYSLLAVGGYGRGELFPYSDVDVLVLLPNGMLPEEDAPLKARLETFIGSCWDAGWRSAPACAPQTSAWPKPKGT
jgi:[protein-PII] uridylyltransferase